MLYINSQCDYLSPSININHINVINSPPLTSMTKGHSPLGTGLYMQGVDTQESRRLLISTVRESLKVKKNFQNQVKSNLVL